METTTAKELVAEEEDADRSKSVSVDGSENSMVTRTTSSSPPDSKSLDLEIAANHQGPKQFVIKPTVVSPESKSTNDSSTFLSHAHGSTQGEENSVSSSSALLFPHVTMAESNPDIALDSEETETEASTVSSSRDNMNNYHQKKSSHINLIVSDSDANVKADVYEDNRTSEEAKEGFKWSKLPRMQYARSRFASAAHDGNIYVFGGNGGNGGNGKCKRLNKMEMFSTKTILWEELGTMKNIRSQCSCAVVGDDIYVIGGMVNEERSASKTVDIFNTKTKTWSTLTSQMKYGRSQHSSVAIGQCIYVLGGYRCNGLTEVLDTVTGQWSVLRGAMNIHRYSFAAVAIENEIFAIGGKCDFTKGNKTGPQYHRYLDSIEVYDIIADEWSISPSCMRYRRCGCSAILTGTTIEVIGGQDETGLVIPVESFDLIRKWWSGSKINPPDDARTDFVALTIDRKLFVCGGSSQLLKTNMKPLTSMEYCQLPSAMHNLATPQINRKRSSIADEHSMLRNIETNDTNHTIVDENERKRKHENLTSKSIQTPNIPSSRRSARRTDFGKNPGSNKEANQTSRKSSARSSKGETDHPPTKAKKQQITSGSSECCQNQRQKKLTKSQVTKRFKINPGLRVAEKLVDGEVCICTVKQFNHENGLWKVTLGENSDEEEFTRDEVKQMRERYENIDRKHKSKTPVTQDPKIHRNHCEDISTQQNSTSHSFTVEDAEKLFAQTEKKLKARENEVFKKEQQGSWGDRIENLRLSEFEMKLYGEYKSGDRTERSAAVAKKLKDLDSMS